MLRKERLRTLDRYRYVLFFERLHHHILAVGCSTNNAHFSLQVEMIG